ncbi:hypothetical protein EIP86_004946 [Pleurotus ostreatoroseus]|nr:hypothetical protein EIP86_004946 [Pleurotus ostreatoroseus]
MAGMLVDPQNQFKFPAMSPPKLVSSPSKPIPVSASSSGRRSPRSSLTAQMGLTAVYESTAEQGPYPDMPPFSALSSPGGHPASLPSFGLHGLARASVSTAPSPEQRTFPKHVRKTSFDHTVAKDGIFVGVSGRHQVNGRPLSPKEVLGMKRRADAPHAESMLRGDPVAVDAVGLNEQHDVERGSPFPSTAFNFSFPPTPYDNYFEVPGGAGSPVPLSQSLSHPMKQRLSEQGFSDPSLNGTYSPVEPNSEGLSAAAAAASAAVAEGYATLNVANMAHLDEHSLDYQQILSMGMMFPGLEGHGALHQHQHHPYTHVDPTQILPLEHGEGPFASFHPSPSSDGWGNGLGSSSNASPEPYNTSNASTPPSVEGLPSASAGGAGGRGGRKIASAKRMSQEAGRGGRKKCVFGSSVIVRDAHAHARGDSTPELGSGGGGKGEEGESAPTKLHGVVRPLSLKTDVIKKRCVLLGALGGARLMCGVQKESNSRKGGASLPKLAASSTRPRSSTVGTTSGGANGSRLSPTSRMGAGAASGSMKRQRRTSAGAQMVSSAAASRKDGGGGGDEGAGTTPRAGPPPSSYPGGLQPVASRDLHGPHRRASRTELDFEQALRAEGTVVLKESLDVDALGVFDASNSSIGSISPFASPTPPPKGNYADAQPATPTVVPPTPSPTSSRGAGPSTSTLHSRDRDSTSSSSGREIFYDALEDTDLQTKRRSMYRSPGTASSPDLATLLRKSKREAAAAQAQAQGHAHPHPHEGRPAHANTAPLPPLTPNRFHNEDFGTPSPSRSRGRASTSSTAAGPTLVFPLPTTSPKGKGRANMGMSSRTSASSNADSSWVLASPRSMASMKDITGKASMSSVRAKTTAFLGKMLGASSTRERSRTVTSPPTSPSSYTAHHTFDAFPPPVPPLPNAHSRGREFQNVADAQVFSRPSISSNVEKPLPEINSEESSPVFDDSDDDQSVVLVPPRAARTPSPTATVTHDTAHSGTISQTRNKRRSMSVSDVDLKRVMAASSSTSPLPRASESSDSGWHSTLSGIIKDFKGEFLQLDRISTSFDLPDPYTPVRRPGSSGRSKSDNTVPTAGAEAPYAGAASSSSVPVPTPSVTIHAESGTDESLPSSPVKTARHLPRGDALASPLRSRSGSGSVPQPQPRVSGLRYGPRSPVNRSAITSMTYIPSSTRESDRLRVQHRSTASSSEPSLIPVHDEGRLSASQQDLNHDLALRRFASNRSPSKTEETADIATRGKELATRCWQEDEEFLAKDKIAEWLGGQGLINKVALRHYMDFFDFSEMRLDNAFRRLCAKLYLKAETQQVDRILEEFARRYWDCNPKSLFGSANLHVAELTSRMSRGQFVRNTITAIQMQLQPGSSADLAFDDWSSMRGGSDVSDNLASTSGSGAGAGGRSIKRSDSITSWNSVTREAIGARGAGASSGQLTTASSDNASTGTPALTSANESAVSVASSHPEVRTPESSAPPMVYDRSWENDMEIMLKEIYSSVKSQQILQPLGSMLMARSSTSSLSPHGAVLRNRSLRGQQPDRLTNLKRGSIRGLQSILTSQGGFSPYGNILDGRASPAPSFASDGMHGSSVTFLTPALGFASNLSHTIIREAQEDDSRSTKSDESSSTEVSITDEELALLGPPWAKEGMLCRKQYWESTGKRAKSKAWLDVFVVIQKGELSMFVFGDHGSGGGSVVGGGNWLENAQSVGSVQLAHSLAHALPPPGYNRQRPHCMVLTLSNGGVYFFQAGTEELVNEWVATCNYWAARQSKEPLAGGVSNMEYGWNRVLDPVTRVRSASEDNLVDNSDQISVRSGRSGKSKFSGKKDFATVRQDKSPWGDRTFINDWKPPMPPSVSSTHDEEAQLEALRKHVMSLKDDLVQHNELRTPMLSLYSPRSSNRTKAEANWGKRSQWILAEIVKYESYIDSLQSAMALRLKKRGEKALERALAASGGEDAAAKAKSKKWKGKPRAETIEESEEPPPSARLNPSPSRSQFHRRELAET